MRRSERSCDSKESSPVLSAGMLNLQLVLLVEDSPDQQRHHVHSLQLAEADVVLKCNVDAAIDILAKSPSRFDAVVIDVAALNKDGIKLIRKVRQLEFSGAVVAITADGSRYTKRRWFHSGGDAYLVKPVLSETLVSVVHQRIMSNKTTLEHRKKGSDPASISMPPVVDGHRRYDDAHTVLC